MNPSGSGWITKLLRLMRTNSEHEFESLEQLYPKLRNVGFLYGSNMATLCHVKDNPDYTNEERCKINLLILHSHYAAGSILLVLFAKYGLVIL